MVSKFARRTLGLILAFTLGLALSARSVAAGPTLGMVADNSTNKVTVFNADTDTIIGSVSVPNPQVVMGDCQIAVDKRTGYVTNFNQQVYQIDLTQSPPALRTGFSSRTRAWT